MSDYPVCPNCEGHDLCVFYELKGVPVHSVLLMASRQEALACPRRDIVLGFCRQCGFICNLAFDETVHQYSEIYEATQGYSPTFGRFHRSLAARLIGRYDLYDKDIIEIGCDKGEFLTLLCRLGNNRGLGFDPAYVPGRNGDAGKGRVRFVKDFYSEKYADCRADFICCKMTLEHIAHPAAFVQSVRRAIGDQDAVVFFQVPDVTRILKDVAFWDIYYEHCSYFSPASLAYVFRASGFEVLDLKQAYDGQYLTIEARPCDVNAPVPTPDLRALSEDVAAFAQNHRLKQQAWGETLQQMQGKRVAVWGGGSKCVALLTTLHASQAVDCVVDINPHKHGTFLAGTGHEIVGPTYLKTCKPDAVVVMNPIYRDEITRDLHDLGLYPELLLAV